MNNNNFLQEIRQRRDNFLTYAKKALEFGWVSRAEYDEYMKSIEGKNLTIGVIGQMKCGKSTFLNALVFQDEKLPAATTPMTAALSVITYGEKESLEVEFYSKEDWNELKIKANKSREGVSEGEELEIKAAQELVYNAQKTPNLESLLGTKKEDSLDKLIEYVGAEGKYTPITLSVKIKYPLEYLKGVEIVDTPGFNDPIVSREERTREFLKKADAVVFLLAANRAFDATDKNVILKALKEVGIGKILIGVNKYDACLENGEREEEIIENIAKQLKKTARENDWRDNPIAHLLENANPLLLAASFALMARMPLSKIRNSNWNDYYNKADRDLGIKTQEQMYKVSKMTEFEEALKEQLINSKEEILLAKPKNAILQKGVLKSNELISLIDKLENENKTASMSKEEAQAKQKQVKKGIEEIEEAIDDFGYEIEGEIRKPIKALVRGIEDTVIEGRKQAVSKVESFSNRLFFNWNGDKNAEKLKREVNMIYEETKRAIERKYRDENEAIHEVIEGNTAVFIRTIEKHCKKYFEDFRKTGLIGEIKNFLETGKLPIDDNDAVFHKQKQEDPSVGEVIGFIVLSPIVSPFVLLGGGQDINKEEYIEKIKENFNVLIPQNLEKNLSTQINNAIDNIRKIIIDKSLNPINKQLQERINEVTISANKIEENKRKIADSEKQSKDLEAQISEMKHLASQI